MTSINMSAGSTSNTSTQATDSSSSFCPMRPDFPMKVGFTAAYLVMFLVALFGNAVVIHLFRTKKRRISFTLLVINLAACDILYACVVVPDSISYLFYDALWFSGSLGEFLCKFWKFLNHIVVTESIATFLIIAVDRYLSIAHVRKQLLSRKSVRVALVVSWLVSALMSSTETYKFNLVTIYGGRSVCVSLWDEDFVISSHLSKINTNIKFVLIFALPTTIMFILYAHVIRYLCQRHGVPSHQMQSNRRTRHVIKMLVTMVTIFVLAWLPLHVMIYLIFYDLQTFACRVPLFPRYLFFCVAHANCAINPCLYLVFNTEYRQDVKELLQQAVSCCSSGVRLAVRHVTPRRAIRPLSLEPVSSPATTMTKAGPTSTSFT